MTSGNVVCKSCGKTVAGYIPKKGNGPQLVTYVHMAQNSNVICEGSNQPGTQPAQPLRMFS